VLKDEVRNVAQDFECKINFAPNMLESLILLLTAENADLGVPPPHPPRDLENAGLAGHRVPHFQAFASSSIAYPGLAPWAVAIIAASIDPQLVRRRPGGRLRKCSARTGLFGDSDAFVEGAVRRPRDCDQRDSQRALTNLSRLLLENGIFYRSVFLP
jgi:hypothetical protein